MIVGEEKPKKIIFVSATCKAHKLMKRFEETFLLSAKENKGIFPEFSLTFQYSGLDVDLVESARNADLVVTDKVTSVGGKNKLFFQQVQAILKKSKRENVPKIYVLPRTSEDRREAFNLPEKLIGDILTIFDLREKKLADKIIVPSFSTIVNKTPPRVKNQQLLKLNILISLPSHFDRNEQEELGKIVSRCLKYNCSVVITNRPREEEIKLSHLIFLGCEEEICSQPRPEKKEKRKRYSNQNINWHRKNACNFQAKQDAVVFSEFQRLKRIGYVKKTNPIIQIVLVDEVLSSAILKFCESISSFLEFPFEEEAVAVVLQRAIKEIEKEKPI